MAGVVGTVTTMLCRGMGIIASVMLSVRPPCVGSLALRWGLGRGSIGARAQEGSGEVELAPEDKGSGESDLALEAKGWGEAEPAPEPWRSWVFCFYSFLFFLSL